MIDWIDWALVVLYTVAVGCATYILYAHRKYFAERFKTGIVSAFMLAMLFFLSAYDVKMIVAVWIRASDVLWVRTLEMQTLQRGLWMIAQLGTTAGLFILALLTYKRRYDLWFVLRKYDKKGDKK